MHELSLIGDLMVVLEESAGENGIVRVKKVRLVVGESYGALPEALDTAFRVLSLGTRAEGAELEVERVELVLHCLNCGREFSDGAWPAPCPSCGSFRWKMLKGRELYLDYYEGETESDLD